MNSSHGPHNQRHPPPSPQFITCSAEPGSSSSASSSHPQHQHEHQSAIFGRPAKMPRLLQQQSQPQQRFTSIGLPSGMSSQQKAANAIEEEMDHIVPDGTKDIQQISYMRFVRMFMSGKLKFPSDPREHRFGIEDLRDLGEIGAGRFGRVNKVLHTPTGREMAVKRVRVLTNRFDDSDDVRSMVQLQKEVRAIQDASTGAATDVVRYYGLTFHEGDCLICMELMDLSLERLYKTVHRVSKELGFDETVLGIVGVTVLNALSDLKEVKRIIHRDVKPSNILLNFRGQIKLCDFGISGYLEDSIARTKDVGCRPYMSPERLTATQDEYDIRTDVWSLGISLIETARGEYPYPDLNDKTFFAQIQQVVFGDPLFLGPMDNYSQKTIQFVNMCLIKEYRDRPTYEELMLTEFYRFFNSISDKLGPVSRYIQRILALEENLRN